MDESQLNAMIRKDPVMNRVTWGVFARNELPTITTLLPGAYVVNSRTRRTGGQHWFLIYVEEEEGRPVEFYDSLGKDPKDYDLNIECIYNERRVQAENTETCGLYVLYFLYWRSRGVNMHDILLTLNQKNNTVNERIVLEHCSLLLMLP